MHNRVPPPIKREQQFGKKQELIPLDLEKIKDEILLLTTSRYTCTRVREAWNYNTMDRDDFIPLGEDDDFMDDIKQILSKYGTTQQKKFTEEEVRNIYRYKLDNFIDTIAPGIIITFLRKVGLLQE